MGDGNLHPTFLTDERNRDEMHRIEQAFKEIFDEAIRLGERLPVSMGSASRKSHFFQNLPAMRRCA